MDFNDVENWRFYCRTLTADSIIMIPGAGVLPSGGNPRCQNWQKIYTFFVFCFSWGFFFNILVEFCREKSVLIFCWFFFVNFSWIFSSTFLFWLNFLRVENSTLTKFCRQTWIFYASKKNLVYPTVFSAIILSIINSYVQT